MHSNSLTDTVDYHIKAAWLSISRMYNIIASQEGTTRTVGYILLCVPKEGIPATKIAPILGQETTSLSRILKNMEDFGLIYRKGDSIDKRKVKIFLTPRGVQQRKFAKRVVQDFNEEIERNINKKDLQIFFKVMKQIHTLVEEYKLEKVEYEQ